MKKSQKLGPVLPAPVEKQKKRPASAGQNSSQANSTAKKPNGRTGSSQQFNPSASQMSQGSQQQQNWGRSTNQSNMSKTAKLNSSFEEKKNRLSRLKSMLKGEKETLQEELGDSSEEEFELLQKESAMKEFQKQVKKQEERGGGGGGAVRSLQSSMTLKKENGLFINLNNAQDERDLQSTITSNVTKNPRPNRDEPSQAPMKNNFLEAIEQKIDYQPLDTNNIGSTATNEPKIDPKRRRIHTLKERIKCCIQIQSVVRMFIEKQRFKKEKHRVALLLQEHTMSKAVNQYEEEVEQELYAMGRGGFSVNVKSRYSINFPSVNIAGSENLQANVFYPTLLKNLAELGHLDLMNDPAKVAQSKNAELARTSKPKANNLAYDDDEDLVDPENKAERTFKLFKARMNPLRKKKSDFLPMNVPLQRNNYFSDNGIIDCFVRRNLNNIPVSLKKSTSDQFTKTRLPEQYSKRTSLDTKLNGKQTNGSTSIAAAVAAIPTEEDSAYYNDTFEKDSLTEVTPISKRIEKKNIKKGVSESIVSEEDYLHESFEIEETEQSASSMIKESIIQNSSKRSNSAAGVEESMINESIQDYSIQEESMDVRPQTNNNNNNKKTSNNNVNNNSIQEEVIVTSVEEQYDSEFEAISEDLNNSMQQRSGLHQSISEDIAGNSFESSRLSKKKKSVSFGGAQKKVQQQQQQVQHPAAPTQTLQASGSGILRKSSEQLLSSQQQHQQKQSEQQQQQYSNLQIAGGQKQHNLPTTTIITTVTPGGGVVVPLQSTSSVNKHDAGLSKYLIAEPVSEMWKKYENLKVQYESEAQLRELTKEQVEMGRIQRDIYSMLDSTKKLTDKWKNERENLLNSERDVSQQADYLYSKFQCEFNRLLNNTAYGSKFSLLSNFFDYKERKAQMSYTQNSNSGGSIHSSNQTSDKLNDRFQKNTPSLQIESMMQKIETKQEIMSGVLMQIVENLTQMQRNQLDFKEMRDNRRDNDSKLDRLLANQEKILKQQYESQLSQKDSDIKLLLQALQTNGVSVNAAQLDPEQMRKLRLKSLLQSNASGTQQTVPQPNQNKYPQQIPKGINDSINSESFESSVDHEAGELKDSGISWQSERSAWENLTERDKEKINEFNTEEVVDFLSKMLLEELQGDLFPVRMATSHFNTHKKPSDQFLLEKMNTKMVPNSSSLTKSQLLAEQKRGTSGLSSSIGQDSPYNRRGSQKSDRTLTEESKYDDDFEDSEEKFHQSLHSNLNNKSYQFEDSESSAMGSATNNLSGRAGNLNAKQSIFDVKDNKRVQELDDEHEEDLEDNKRKQNQDQDSEVDYAEDLAEEENFSVSVDEKPVVQLKQTQKAGPLKVTKPIETSAADAFDPMGMGGNRAFDRNSLLAEIEENDKKGGSSSIGSSKPKSPRANIPFDEDLKGDNDFFEEKVKFENGQERQDMNKELYKNEEYYESTSRALVGLVGHAKKQKKKQALIKTFTKLLSTNCGPNKKVDTYLGQLSTASAATKGGFVVFEQSEVKEENKSIAQAFSEKLFANLIKNTHDLEQFHHGQVFNKKLIESELSTRWDHICDVSSKQTLEILEKVVPVEYYNDVKISKHTPDTKVRRFCKINPVPKDDLELFEVQEYELYKEQIHVQNAVANNILQQLARSLAKDILQIQKKQEN